MQRKGLLSAPLVGAALLVSSLMSADLASAHGWITSPPSRQDHCKNNRTSFDCGDVKYEPQSVEAAKGSMSCSGGSRFPILDNNSLPWPVTTVGSTVTFNWFCTACHVTMNWQYFVDGQLKATYNGNGQPGVNTSHTVSGLPSGRHTILGRWNIGDTPAAFYACVDVNVGGGGGGTATPTRAATATATRTATPTTGARATATATARARATATPTTGGGTGCSGIPAFQSCTAYSSGAVVSFNGSRYRAIAPIPSTRDCPPNSPYNPSTDNWWVNEGGC